MSRAAPRSRRDRPAKAPLSREAIVDAALMILERDGAKKLTIRSVAAELDTGPASLYVYVPSATALHALLVDRLLGALDLGWEPSEPWRDRLDRVLGDYVSLLAERGDLARAVMFVWPDGPHYLDLIDLLVRLLRSAGAGERTIAWGIDVLLQQASATAAEWAAHAAGTGQDLADLTGTLRDADRERHAALVDVGPDAFTQGTHEERAAWARSILIDGIIGTSR